MASRRLYRAMIPSADGEPVVGEERNMLGVRPGEKAMSVFLDPARLPNPIRPKAVLNGYGEPGYNAETVLYALDGEELAIFQLCLGDVDKKTHCGVRHHGCRRP